MSVSTREDLQRVIHPDKIIKGFLWRTPKRISIDSRTISRGDAFLALRGKWHDGHQFIKKAVEKGACLVISEDERACVDLKTCTYIVDDSYRTLERISRFILKERSPCTIAVTGSIGKTTTKEMIAYLLKDTDTVLKNEKTENNFLGVAKTVLRLSDEKIVVMELGTNAPGEIKHLTSIVRPDIGVITYIKPAHTEKLPTLGAILKEKREIVTRYAKTQAVLNYDDRFLRQITSKKRIVWFGMKKQAAIHGHLLKVSAKESLFSVNGKYRLRLRTPFSFYIYNVLAALAVGDAYGESLEKSVEKMSEFTFDFPGRMEETRKKGVIFINDAYNSNPFAVRCAMRSLSCYPQPKIAVIGDMYELGEKSLSYHRSLAKDMLPCGFEYVLTLGEHSRVIKAKLQTLGYDSAFHFSCQDELIDFLKKGIPQKNYLIFVKGSRGMAMEKIIEKY